MADPSPPKPKGRVGRPPGRKPTVGRKGGLIGRPPGTGRNGPNAKPPVGKKKGSPQGILLDGAVDGGAWSGQWRFNNRPKMPTNPFIYTKNAVDEVALVAKGGDDTPASRHPAYFGYHREILDTRRAFGVSRSREDPKCNPALISPVFVGHQAQPRRLRPAGGGGGGGGAEGAISSVDATRAALSGDWEGHFVLVNKQRTEVNIDEQFELYVGPLCPSGSSAPGTAAAAAAGGAVASRESRAKGAGSADAEMAEAGAGGGDGGGGGGPAPNGDAKGESKENGSSSSSSSSPTVAVQGKCVVHGHGSNQFGPFSLHGSYVPATNTLVCDKRYDPARRPRKGVGGAVDGERRASKRKRTTSQKLTNKDLGSSDFAREKRGRSPGDAGGSEGGGTAGGDMDGGEEGEGRDGHRSRAVGMMNTEGGGGGRGDKDRSGRSKSDKGKRRVGRPLGSGRGPGRPPGSTNANKRRRERERAQREAAKMKRNGGSGGGAPGSGSGNDGDSGGGGGSSSSSAQRAAAVTSFLGQTKRVRRRGGDSYGDGWGGDSDSDGGGYGYGYGDGNGNRGGGGKKKSSRSSSSRGSGRSGGSSSSSSSSSSSTLDEMVHSSRPAPLPMDALRKRGMLASEGLCCHVCELDVQDKDNLLMCCSGCYVVTHQMCYGVTHGAVRKLLGRKDGKWMCRPCEAGVEPGRAVCALCPVPYGAFKRTTDLRWVHLACALWIPEAAFLDPRSMEPIGSVSEHGETGGIDGIPRWRYDLNCTHCSSDPAVKYAGACVKCTFPGCTYAVHPMCTRMAEGGKDGEAPHLCLTMDDTGAVVNGFTVSMHCPDHMSEAMRDRVIDSAALRARYVEAAKEALTMRLEQARQAAEERQRALEARKAAGVWKKAKEDDNGQTYEGETNTGGKRHGQGTCVYQNKHVYEGQWKDHKEHGNGFTLNENGEVMHDGEYQEGRVHGKGTYFFDNGDKYVGDFNQAMRHGRGCYTEADSSTYEGEWRDDLKHGTGTFVAPDNSTYTGGWIKDLRHGRGTLRLSTGFVFDGLWMDGQMEGRGICTYPDGSRFEGMWKGGRKEGRGTLVFPNSAVYEGRFRDDQMDGTGTFKMSSITQLNTESEENETAWLVPIDSQSNVKQIHRRAGFDEQGL